MYVNAKTIPAETVPGIRGRRMGKGGGFKYNIFEYLIHSKNLCKCYNVLISSTIKTNNLALK
jgi:hypothetical protein